MKRTLPLLITAVSGLVLIVSTFIPVAQPAGEIAAVWFDLLASIAFVLGGGNLLRLHLKKVSDGQAGWGYSVITVVSFLTMLLLGMFKFGAPPEQNVEFFGQSFVDYPLELMPEFRVAGNLPERADHAPWPASVRRQLRESSGEIVFQSWMLPDQESDLADFKESLRWRAAVEELAERAAIPAALRGKAVYLADHEALAFTGFMSDADRAALLEALGGAAPAVEAVDQLMRLSRRPASVAVTRFPDGFSIPDEAAAYISRSGNQLTINGPLSPALRHLLVSVWPNAPRSRPLSPQLREELRNDVERRGAALNPDQAEAFNAFFDADWKPELLIQALNTAGIASPEAKSARELLAEIEAGAQDPPTTRPAPPPVLLNDAQEAAVRQFVADPSLSPAQLVEELGAGGELTDRQRQAVAGFLSQQPTIAEQRKELYFRLRRLGPLSAEQREFLLGGFREQFQWQQDVGRLYVAAHQTKYPWSGDYSAQGTPFWWLYQYVFQPLLTTTFAMLAFYVASAAFRAFRAKNLDAVLLLGTAFIILLGRTFAGYALTSWFPDWLAGLRIDQLTIYIMSTFVTAGNRAIMIGIALGIVSTSLKVLLGIDRTYLGGKE